MDTISTQDVGKKLWRLVKIVLFMLRKGISKNKLMSELNLVLKRGNKLAGKAIGHLTSSSAISHHHYSASSAFGCRSNDALSFVSPRSNREYEFSCSNSPAIGHAFNLKRKHHHHYQHQHQHNYGFFGSSAGKKGGYKYDDVSTAAAVQKVLEMLNNNGAGDQVGASPLVFGKSPMVRQLRITDSPYPLKDEEDSRFVNMAADEFIKKFYKELNSQNNITSYLESPNYHTWWGS